MAWHDEYMILTLLFKTKHLHNALNIWYEWLVYIDVCNWTLSLQNAGLVTYDLHKKTKGRLRYDL